MLWQPQPETGSASGSGRFRFDPAAMHFSQLLCKRKPNSKSTAITFDTSFRLTEHVENLWQECRRNTLARVFHFKAGEATVFRQCNRDTPPTRCELERVAKQIP